MFKWLQRVFKLYSYCPAASEVLSPLSGIMDKINQTGKIYCQSRVPCAVSSSFLCQDRKVIGLGHRLATGTYGTDLDAAPHDYHLECLAIPHQMLQSLIHKDCVTHNRQLSLLEGISVLYHYSAQAKGQVPSLKSNLVCFVFFFVVTSRQSRDADWFARAVFQSRALVMSFHCEEACSYSFGLPGLSVPPHNGSDKLKWIA